MKGRGDILKGDSCAVEAQCLMKTASAVGNNVMNHFVSQGGAFGMTECAGLLPGQL